MTFSSQYVPYLQTDSFSGLVLDYLQGDFPEDFYQYRPVEGQVLHAIKGRQSFPCDRQALVDHLTSSCEGVQLTELTQNNIRYLLSSETFTVCTAHQPNLFTGHLYFIYKILHVIKLAEVLNLTYPQHRFVPVYYMGSEDADLQELGSFEVRGKKYQWTTGQTGAVGRMSCDTDLLGLINELEGQLSVEPFGHELIGVLKDCYRLGDSIQQCTLRLVNHLFGKYGLVIFLPDHPAPKAIFAQGLSAELKEAVSSSILQKTIARFPAGYKIQAEGRDINLFYLDGNKRERIEPFDDGAVRLVESGRILKREEWEQELKEYPERFSPNVILRPLFQEKILPNIIFVGGGSELAYWLELKEVFGAFGIHYPMLLLRNSFQIFDNKELEKLGKIGLQPQDIFVAQQTLEENLVRAGMNHGLDLEIERQRLANLYEEIREKAALTDVTLEGHIKALEKKASDKILELEKKIMRAAKRKNTEQINRLKNVLASLKPSGSLQERVDNFLPYYAQFGVAFLEEILKNSAAFSQEFCLLLEKE